MKRPDTGATVDRLWGQRAWLYPAALALAVLMSTGAALPSTSTAGFPRTGEREHVEQLRRQVARLEASTQEWEERLADPNSDEVYLVVNTQANRLQHYRGNQMLREAVVSTGSGRVLRRPGGGLWVFRTPRGVRLVQRKIENPVWVKPDWAFLEEGKAVPPPGHPSRFTRGVLGAYALDLGGQIKLHGTKEIEKLGRAVSHGCIRVGDEDLEAIYHATPVGARVFIY